MASVYDSERLAAAYARDRPPIHEQILRAARSGRQADRALEPAAARSAATNWRTGSTRSSGGSPGRPAGRRSTRASCHPPGMACG